MFPVIDANCNKLVLEIPIKFNLVYPTEYPTIKHFYVKARGYF